MPTKCTECDGTGYESDAGGKLKCPTCNSLGIVNTEGCQECREKDKTIARLETERDEAQAFYEGQSDRCADLQESLHKAGTDNQALRDAVKDASDCMLWYSNNYPEAYQDSPMAYEDLDAILEGAEPEDSDEEVRKEDVIGAARDVHHAHECFRATDYSVAGGPNLKHNREEANDKLYHSVEALCEAVERLGD